MRDRAKPFQIPVHQQLICVCDASVFHTNTTHFLHSFFSSGVESDHNDHVEARVKRGKMMVKSVDVLR